MLLLTRSDDDSQHASSVKQIHLVFPNHLVFFLSVHTVSYGRQFLRNCCQKRQGCQISTPCRCLGTQSYVIQKTKTLSFWKWFPFEPCGSNEIREGVYPSSAHTLSIERFGMRQEIDATTSDDEHLGTIMLKLQKTIFFLARDNLNDYRSS